MAIVVSKAEPLVSTEAAPLRGAVHEYHTEWPPGLPTICGSPFSSVAAVVSAVRLPEAALRACAAAKLSFAGRAAVDALQFSVNLPYQAAPPVPS